MYLILLMFLAIYRVRHKKSKKLSVGERRRLSIAEEICHGPSLLLIDEPTTGQDVLDEAIMMQTFREMVNQDRTVVAAVHTVNSFYTSEYDNGISLNFTNVISPPQELCNYSTEFCY